MFIMRIENKKIIVKWLIDIESDVRIIRYYIKYGKK